jgi:hypothetical protein
MDLPWWAMGLLLVLLVGLIGVFFWQRNKQNDDD